MRPFWKAKKSEPEKAPDNDSMIKAIRIEYIAGISTNVCVYLPEQRFLIKLGRGMFESNPADKSYEIIGDRRVGHSQLHKAYDVFCGEIAQKTYERLSRELIKRRKDPKFSVFKDNGTVFEETYVTSDFLEWAKNIYDVSNPSDEIKTILTTSNDKINRKALNKKK